MHPSTQQIEMGFRYMEWLSNKLYREHTLTFGHKSTKFGRASSYHKLDAPIKGPHRSHQLTFGRRSIYIAFLQGFTEYKSLAHVIRGLPMWGFRGLHQIVLHEFAHVLQIELPGGRGYQSVHNRYFAEEYRELMQKYQPEPTIEAWLETARPPLAIRELARQTKDTTEGRPPFAAQLDTTLPLVRGAMEILRSVADIRAQAHASLNAEAPHAKLKKGE